MTVILVLLTFAVFILIDTMLSRRKAAAQAHAPEAQPAAQPAPAYVDGFRVPEGLRYHPGHAWLVRERRNVVRVGVDEFAAALLGSVSQVELPKPGHWVRQGQKSLTFQRGEETTQMLSPIEGEVVEVNAEVLKDPSLLRKDPYGKGWLMTVFAPDEENVSRNLLPTGLVARWMQDAVERLYARQPQLAGLAAADGGIPVEDLASALPGVSWKELTSEFFLTS